MCIVCYCRRVTISEATQSMLAYSQLNDGILNVIKLLVDDPEVRMSIYYCYHSSHRYKNCQVVWTL